jgi:hypothetical protein
VYLAKYLKNQTSIKYLENRVGPTTSTFLSTIADTSRSTRRRSAIPTIRITAKTLLPMQKTESLIILLVQSMKFVYKKSSPVLTASELEATIFTGVDTGIMGTIVAKLCR